MNVRELNQNQLNELKVRYIFEHDPNPSWGDVEFAKNVPNEVIFKEYDGIYFVEEDFFCSEEE